MLLSIASVPPSGPGGAERSSSVRAATSARVVVSPAVDEVTPFLTPGAHGELLVNVKHSATCTLAFAGPSRLRSGPFTVAVRRPHVDFTWRVARGAAPGSWNARLRCSARRSKKMAVSSAVSQTLQVSGASKRRAQAIVKPGSLHVRFLATAPTEPLDRGRQTNAGRGAGFEFCQCTWYANYRRPDIYSYALQHGVKGVWDGKAWAENAAAAGELTGAYPVAGALVSFQPGGRYATDPQYGHVAYVESVAADGRSFTTSAMSGWDCNKPYAGRIYTNRFVAPATGMTFIYGPPGSRTPVTVGSGPTAGGEPPLPPKLVQHVYSATSSGAVYETYYGPGVSRTTSQIATVGSGVVGVSSQVTSGEVQHVYSATSSGAVYETYYGPGVSSTTSQIATVGSGVVGVTDQVTH
jgi:surface antigen